jgi:ABC-type phosphate transport system substrate-binding protein
LFNDSLGCYMTQPSGTTQTLGFQCATANGGNQAGVSYTENPINDVATEEPALGSSAGVQQLEFGGTGSDGAVPANPTAVVNYARSSRANKTSDYPGLNFVAYATDGVSFLTFPEVNGKATPSAKVKNLTTPQLASIFQGKTKNWDKVGGTNATICVYVAQTSSGTESTWASNLISSGTPALLNAYVDGLTSLNGCKTPKNVSYATSHTIFENEAQDIVKNGDEANAIFFFSYGKYQVVCGSTPATRTAQCDNNLSTTTTKTYLGSINGVAPSPTTILCDTKACSAAFPVIRDLYNVYSNGTFPVSKSAEFGFPAATPATINYVSEIGFLCKPQLTSKGAKVVDPSTGAWYRTEITTVIKSQGFIPFPLQTRENQGSVDASAAAVLKAESDKTYLRNDPIAGATIASNEAKTDPSGYCEVWTTDQNTAPA